MKLICLAAMLLLMACNKKKDDTTSTPVAADYGVYSLCENADGASVKQEVFYNQTSLVGSFTIYTGTGCMTGQEFFNERDIYSYTKSGTDYTLVVASVLLTPLSTDAVTYLNGDALCQLSNWATNTPQNILGRSCEGSVINAGDSQQVAIYKSGSSLVLKDGADRMTYARVHAIDYANTSQSFTDGNYVYFDGTRAVYLNLASPNFTMRVYDEATLRYYVKTGSYTSASNVGVFSVTTNTPTCGTDAGTVVNRKFITSTKTMAMEGLEGSDWILEKVNYTSTQFQNAYLVGTYTQQCF